ncbi:hypothetical protein QAD02_023105 [Eretmocerus hayati]|uniref:Uncharacterized protein n=1 Tax=Eretmocerus hayati TaxID=131215 RepID=A0ACC2PX11_9HYME|nr:hypothetical protein QAD02_023105 [Eretmocerus hayati]
MASTRSSDSERPGSEDAGQNRYPNPFLEFGHKVRSDFQLGRNHPGQQAWVKMDGDEIHIILQDETDYVVGGPEALTDDEAVDGVLEVNIGPEDEIVEEPHNGRRNDCRYQQLEPPDMRDDVSMASYESISLGGFGGRLEDLEKMFEEMKLRVKCLMRSQATMKRASEANMKLTSQLIDNQRDLTTKINRVLECNEQSRRDNEESRRALDNAVRIIQASCGTNIAEPPRQALQANRIQIEADVHVQTPPPVINTPPVASSTTSSQAAGPSSRMSSIQEAPIQQASAVSRNFHADRKYQLTKKEQWPFFWIKFSAELRSLGLDLVAEDLTAKRGISEADDQQMKDLLVHRVDHDYLKHAMNLPTALEMLRHLRGIKQAETITSSDLARDELKALKYNPRTETGQHFIDKFQNVVTKYAGLLGDSALTEVEIRDAFYSATKIGCPMLQTMKLSLDRQNEVQKLKDPKAVPEVFTLMEMQTVFRNQEAQRPPPNQQRTALLAGFHFNKRQRCFQCQDNHADHIALDCPHRETGAKQCYACFKFVTDHDSKNCPRPVAQRRKRGAQNQPSYQAKRFNKDFENVYYSNNRNSRDMNSQNSRIQQAPRTRGANRSHPYNNNNNARGRGGRGGGRGGHQNRGGRQPQQQQGNNHQAFNASVENEGNENETDDMYPM